MPEVYVHFHPVVLEIEDSVLAGLRSENEETRNDAKSNLVDQLLLCFGENENQELWDAIESVVRT